MSKLNLNLGMAKQIASALGLDPEKVLQAETRQLVQSRMERQIPAIVADMQEDGWTVAAKGEGPVVRDALFRLWRKGVFTFSGGGRLADVIRDSHDDKVIAELAGPVTADTPLEEIVRLAMHATLELAF